jgi:hypothetical protein
MQLLKSTHALNQEFSFGLKFINLTFELTHITFNHGAFELSLGSWAIERQNNQVKHYVSSSLLNHYSRVFINFQNKTQRFHCMTLSSLSYIWYLWIHTKAKMMLCLSLPTTNTYVELIGKINERAYLQYIFCKVKPRIQRELSHTIKSRCACM